MGAVEIGRRIAALRKEKHLTQKELAAGLHITDKAVSKWERGLCCPDIVLLPTLAELLGVTVDALLEETRYPVPCQTSDSMEIARENHTAGRIWLSALFSFLMITAAVVCVICDLAISGAFTWSPIPVIGIGLAWLSSLPVIRWGKRGILWSLTIFTALLLPFLYGLHLLLPDSGLLLTIGIPSAVVSLVFLWLVLALFSRWKSRNYLASALSMLLAIPLCLLINLFVGAPSHVFLDRWDYLSFAILALLAAVFYLCDLKYKCG